jgi:hypothetical protein
MVMKIETIENEKKQSEWTVPCLILHDQGTIVLLSEKILDRYQGVVIRDDDENMIGELLEHIVQGDGWTLYDGKVILSNN